MQGSHHNLATMEMEQGPIITHVEQTGTKTAPVVPVHAAPGSSLMSELVHSADLLFRPKLSWLLVFGLIAVIGSKTGLLGEAMCFTLSGIALIPCAERLSFLTEEVAEYTNGTIGALLNATFGNAPELLIAVAALKSGYYRIVQLAMVGSMITNMIFVFGVACLIGGSRWQVQDLRLTSGNVNVMMLFVSTAGSLFPAALILSKQLPYEIRDPYVPTAVEIVYCRVNAVVMIVLYVCYLIFQLGTHKEEFDEEINAIDNDDEDDGDDNNSAKSGPGRHVRRKAQRNLFCLFHANRVRDAVPENVRKSLSFGESGEIPPEATDASTHHTSTTASAPPTAGGLLNKLTAPEIQELLPRQLRKPPKRSRSDDGTNEDLLSAVRAAAATDKGDPADGDDERNALRRTDTTSVRERQKTRRGGRRERPDIVRRNTPTRENGGVGGSFAPPPPRNIVKAKGSDDTGDLSSMEGNDDSSTEEDDLDLEEAALLFHPTPEPSNIAKQQPSHGASLSMRIAIVWLFIITLCISALSDILVDTIDGFAQRVKLSEVFTSMVVIPFFSNVAEQVSAFLFAYRNEMDLCVGVTIGSAIQIATFVLPGSVLIGMFLNRSMTLYFHGFETVCIFFGVVVVGSILQGGTTNWLVGAILVGIYVIVASGIWFHELENLTVDSEVAIRNQTNLLF